MRIAINTRFLLPDQMEGIGRYTHEICSRLVALRPEDDFLFLFDRPFSEKYIYSSKVQGKNVFPPARHPLLWKWWFDFSLPGHLKSWKADLFVSMDGYLSLKSAVPSLMVIHDLAYLHYPHQIASNVRRYYQKYVPQFLERADMLATVSEFSKGDILSNFNGEQKEIAIIPNGIADHWQPLTEEEKNNTRSIHASGSPFFCTLGAIHPRKNIEGTIRAFEAFKDKTNLPHLLLIVGRMAWKNEALKQLISNSKYKASIQFTGYLEDAEVTKVIGSADALLYLSLFEGFGVPMIEAMKMKVPLVYSDRGVMPEVAGGAGVCVDPMSPDSAAKGMIKVLQKELKNQFSEAGERQLSKYSWDVSAQRMSTMIDEYFARR